MAADAGHVHSQRPLNRWTVCLLRFAMPQPPKPTVNLLSRYIEKWGQLENYRLQEESLGLLFKQLCPENKRIDHVLLKVSALNDFYSTNIFDTYTVAKHILQMDIDQRLKRGDPSLVNELALVSINGRPRKFYSFASKYCSHHDPDAFPIYDSFVEKMLLHYQRVDKYGAFGKGDLKSYERFMRVIREFQEFYGLREFTLRQIDIFLWLTGKECFPRSYRHDITRRSI